MNVKKVILRTVISLLILTACKPGATATTKVIESSPAPQESPMVINDSRSDNLSITYSCGDGFILSAGGKKVLTDLSREEARFLFQLGGLEILRKWRSGSRTGGAGIDHLTSNLQPAGAADRPGFRAMVLPLGGKFAAYPGRGHCSEELRADVLCRRRPGVGFDVHPVELPLGGTIPEGIGHLGLLPAAASRLINRRKKIPSSIGQRIGRAIEKKQGWRIDLPSL